MSVSMFIYKYILFIITKYRQHGHWMTFGTIGYFFLPNKHNNNIS